MWLHYKIENKKTGPRRLPGAAAFLLLANFPQTPTGKI
jgi:hypothetical protein